MAGSRLAAAGSPKGLSRLGYRAPIALYRVGLGFLLGHRFLMLEHRGRKTGKLRRTVLEVVANPPDALYVAAAWAAESDWLKNIEANPQVTVHCGFERFRTDAQVIEEDGARSVLADYAEQHSGAFRRLARFMLADAALTVAENIDRVASTIPFVKLPRPVAGG